MATYTTYATKTELYLRVKKPLLERQRRARINKCLDSLKNLVAEMKGDESILRMDKAEMLEYSLNFMRTECLIKHKTINPLENHTSLDSFRNGYMNAVHEVSRLMASTPGIQVEVGKSVMTHLGLEYNRLLKCNNSVFVPVSRSASPASSGYHSDCETSTPHSKDKNSIWRPW